MDNDKPVNLMDFKKKKEETLKTNEESNAKSEDDKKYLGDIAKIRDIVGKNIFPLLTEIQENANGDWHKELTGSNVIDAVMIEVGAALAFSDLDLPEATSTLLSPFMHGFAFGQAMVEEFNNEEEEEEEEKGDDNEGDNNGADNEEE